MLEDDPYSQEYDSDSNEEVSVDENHLQGFSTLVVSNIQRNDRNLEPAAVQSRREHSQPFEKSCHACGRYGHHAVRYDFLAK